MILTTNPIQAMINAATYMPDNMVFDMTDWCRVDHGPDTLPRPYMSVHRYKRKYGVTHPTRLCIGSLVQWHYGEPTDPDHWPVSFISAWLIAHWKKLNRRQPNDDMICHSRCMVFAEMLTLSSRSYAFSMYNCGPRDVTKDHVTTLLSLMNHDTEWPDRLVKYMDGMNS